MAFTTPPQSPRARPSTVNTAVILLYVAAAIQLLGVILTVVYYGAIQDGAERANELVKGTEIGGQAASGSASAVGTIVVGLLLAAVFVVLGVLVGRGNKVGRILTWVFGGIALCCTGIVIGLTQLGKAGFEAARRNDSSVPTWEQYNDALNSELPSWYGPVTITLAVLGALAILLAVILLALPSSHPFFRKAEPEWQPPLPGSGQPPQQQPPAPDQYGPPPTSP